MWATEYFSVKTGTLYLRKNKREIKQHIFFSMLTCTTTPVALATCHVCIYEEYNVKHIVVFY